MPPRHRLHRCALALLLACAAPVLANDAADVQTLLERDDLPAALERAERALGDKPRDPQLRFLRGVVLMDLRRDADALAAFTQLTQEYPELPDPYNNIAVLQVRAGRPDLALQALQAALRNDPGHRRARANLGQVHLMLAVQAWEQSAAIGPLETPTQRLLEGVRALLQAGSPVAAPR